MKFSVNEIYCNPPRAIMKIQSSQLYRSLQNENSKPHAAVKQSRKTNICILGSARFGFHGCSTCVIFPHHGWAYTRNSPGLTPIPIRCINSNANILIRSKCCINIDINTNININVNINPNIDSESSPTLSPSTAIAQVCRAPASPDNLAAWRWDHIHPRHLASE